MSSSWDSLDCNWLREAAAYSGPETPLPRHRNPLFGSGAEWRVASRAPRVWGDIRLAAWLPRPDTLFKIFFFLQPPAKSNAHAPPTRRIAECHPQAAVQVESVRQTDIGLLPIRRAVGGAKYLPKASWVLGISSPHPPATWHGHSRERIARAGWDFPSFRFFFAQPWQEALKMCARARARARGEQKRGAKN